MKNRLLYLLFAITFLFSFSVKADQVHRVTSGENIYNIAEKYGLTENEIISTNNIYNPESIYQGQIIIIPEINRADIYRVEKGDSLYNISKKLRIPAAVLAEENNIIYQDQLYTKQPLSIPLRYRYPQIYEVASGDTINKIAQKFEISTDEIIFFNNLINNDLEINQKIKIPVLKPAKPYEGPNYKMDYPDTIYYKGKTKAPRIALTFDDGPDSYYTERILEILNDHNIPATFFVLGSTIDLYPEVVEKIVADKHVIANHSWNHPNLAELSKEELKSQIKDTEKIIQEKTDIRVRFLRPPWGFISETLLETAKELEYKIINWDVDSRDWQDQSVDQILINTLPNIREDSIILFHSAGGKNQNLDATVDVLPELIQTLKMNGYTFITVDKLIQTPPYEIK